MSACSLIEMGYWSCRVKASNGGDIVMAKSALQCFGGLTDVQADFVIHSASKSMCNA
jgi:hypothetical protein